MATIDRDSVKAVLDKMPPGPHKLRVTGKADKQITLRPSVPQGINPMVLILEIASESSGPGDFTYPENPAKHDYTDVHIRQAAGDIEKKVLVVN